jgi:hypothetical protein
VRISIRCESRNQSTFLGLSRRDHGAILVALEHRFDVIKLKAAFLFQRPVTFDALPVEHLLDSASPERARIFRAKQRGTDDGEQK